VAITHATGIRYTYPQPQHLCCGHAAWSKFNRRPWSKFDRRQHVFNTQDNATALLSKLRERGVPAYAETRVVVGPFRTRREAEQAAQALKDLGSGRVLRPGAR